MKKTSKVFGAVALSAALAFGCSLPAFAADEYGVAIGDLASDTHVEQGDAISTDVKVATRVTNINVAVPLTVTIVADSAGGDVLHPSAGLKNYANGVYDAELTTGYRIENYSPFPVKITDIATQDTSDGSWALVTADVVDSGTGEAKEALEGKIGDLNLTLVPSTEVDNTSNGNQVDKNEGNQLSTEGVNLADVLVAAGDVTTSGTNPNWVVASKVSADEPAIMGLLLSGTSSILSNVTEGSILQGTAENPADPGPDPVEADKAFKVFYTVSATSLVNAS